MTREAANATKKAGMHNDLVRLAFMKLDKYIGLREIVWLDFIYGGILSSDDKKTLSDATRDFSDAGYW